MLPGGAHACASALGAALELGASVGPTAAVRSDWPRPLSRRLEWLRARRRLREEARLGLRGGMSPRDESEVALVEGEDEGYRPLTRTPCWPRPLDGELLSRLGWRLSFFEALDRERERACSSLLSRCLLRGVRGERAARALGLLAESCLAGDGVRLRRVPERGRLPPGPSLAPSLPWPRRREQQSAHTHDEPWWEGALSGPWGGRALTAGVP